MDANLFNQSLVVLAKQNNPSILNPDFLRIQNIVPDDWTVKGQPITTPPFSQVSYENGYSITVEENKIQITQDGLNLEAGTPSISSITKKYLSTLPHVSYIALGTNFRLGIVNNNPESCIIDKFLKDGPWNSTQHDLQASGIKLVYPCDGGKLTISLDPGKFGSDGKKAIICHANFNRGIESAEPNRDTYIDSVKGDYNQLSQFLIEVFSK